MEGAEVGPLSLVFGCCTRHRWTVYLTPQTMEFLSILQRLGVEIAQSLQWFVTGWPTRGSNSVTGKRLCSKTSRPAQWLPRFFLGRGGNTVEAWSWPFTHIWRQGYKWVEVYLYPLHTLTGTTLPLLTFTWKETTYRFTDGSVCVWNAFCAAFGLTKICWEK